MILKRLKNLWGWSAKIPYPDYGELDKSKVVSLWDKIPSGGSPPKRMATILEPDSNFLDDVPVVVQKI